MCAPLASMAMSIEIEEMGPVDFMVIEFPGGRTSGEGIPLLVDLVDRGIVRILDVVFFRKLADGSIVRIDISRDGDALRVFDGAGSGLFDQEDIENAAEVIEVGSMAGMLMYENRWAAPLATALRRGGAQLVAGGRIPIQALLASIDAAESTSGRR
jgi:uncharacterized protein DUF6325